MIRSLLLSASAGAIVDRVDYFRLLRLTQLFTLCYAVAVAALSFAGLIGIGLLFFLTLARGVMLSCGGRRFRARLNAMSFLFRS